MPSYKKLLHPFKSFVFKMSTLSLLLVAIGFSTLNTVNLEATMKNSYEGILSVEFLNPILSSAIEDKLKPEIAKKSVNIISANTVIDISGQVQTINLSNEEQLNIKDFFNVGKSTHKAFLNTLVDLKAKIDSNQNFENEVKVLPILKKFSKESLNSAKKNQSKLSLNSILLGGDLHTLNALKANNFYGLASEITVVNISELQKQTEDLQFKVEKAKSDTEKQNLISEYLKNSLGYGPDLSASIPIVDKSLVQLANKFVKIDISGNYFVNIDDLKSLNLTNNQISQITKTINFSNKLPPDLKDGSLQAIQEILKLGTFKNELLKQENITNNIIDGLFKSVEATANCNMTFDARRNWWGFEVRLNSCSAQNSRNVSMITTAVGVICWIAGPLGFTCSALVIWLGRYIGAVSFYLRAYDFECGYRGANINISWALAFWASKIC